MNNLPESPSAHKPKHGLLHRRFINALTFSMAGLNRARQEEAIQVELVTLLPLVFLGLWLGANPIEQILLSVPLLAVLVVELLNTAIEVTINRISTDHHELSKQAKDLGSAAVLVSLLIAALCWALILLPRWLG